ncbi:hypothetical protein DPM19_15000 [Actinomadura craniellae]|uniref:DUF4350 domain-containing protein n=1 Tax=Actinomadura craniellae TaxID=2231787 RepID=A0A365H599_9ACTN|nr:DUF4350 domain-containing protein [Actinomadura craniellae]RAY14284.1 hypothetical protein DPM19_15000 [Actinomadura craniellae]
MTATTDIPTAAQVAGRRWRASRAVVFTILGLVAVAIGLAVLRPATSAQFLDPESPAKDGTRALAQLLGQRGTPVQVVRDTAAAARQARPDSVLVVTRFERLGSEQVDQLRDLPGSLILVEPSRDALQALAPGIQRASAGFSDGSVAPSCSLPAATLAGSVAFHRSEAYEAPPTATHCYPSEGLPRVVHLPRGDRTVTVLGSGLPLTNRYLAEAGNAALALNLVGARSSVVWLIPDLPTPGSRSGDVTYDELIPAGVKLAVLQILIAVVLTALWRARRLGAVVTEPLPVAVRSAETVEGRARLYRAHHARDRAADALRAGARERLVPLLGLPRGAAQDPAAEQEIVLALAPRAGWDAAVVGWALYGPAPADDAELVRLADVLDDLERKVRQS